MRTHTGPERPGHEALLPRRPAREHVDGPERDGDSRGEREVLSLRQPALGSITLTDKPAARKFTGQQDEGTAFGLYDYGARFYSTVMGQFTSADPLVGSSGAQGTNLALSSVQGLDLTAKTGGAANSRAPSNPQSLDRYAYALDNPLRYTDPTGLRGVHTRGTNPNLGVGHHQQRAEGGVDRQDG